VREAIEYWSVVTVRGIARRLPDTIIDAWGSALGLMFYALDRPHRRVALTNLQQCFPQRPAGERRAIARATFAHFGQVLLKLLTFSALSPEQMLERGWPMRRAKACCSSPVTSDSGNARRWRMPSSCGRSACWRDRSTIRA
jgi:lauroyl/myristoyl acyltransferase